jgi:AcrR family transcriptional regulator
MMNEELDHAIGPGRPKDPVLDIRIVEAAARVFRERGWLEATMEQIAERAGVSKATLYRRYPSKASVAFAAWVGDRTDRFPETDTGSVWGDLTAYILGSFEMSQRGGWLEILRGLIVEMPRDPSVAEAIAGVWTWRRGAVAEILDRATTRGEVRSDATAEHVNELIDGPILLRLLVTGDAVGVAFADRLIDDVMSVIGPGR